MALSRNRLAGLVALAVAAVTLAGCADYMNRWDRLSLRAGNAPDANSAIQAIENDPAAADNATITFGG